ncbi:hypothetical protein CGI15_16195 [Vibrio parahaemolyticus]|nr:hypothetical protein [Vibrio parahaemolyticus]TOE71081.1 hypothetical protein CGJ37_17550 [Vibrio parahaemolyticus]TOK56087.1 hypothetical protein CGI15_16195 [Vibrio parahaemolyticus]TOR08687.1 hypothetical protein CGG81_04615 [Vibrio parahaemolyticus]HAS6533797.1 hypothetical protein [Vibrio parahaemolyticus]
MRSNSNKKLLASEVDLFDKYLFLNQKFKVAIEYFNKTEH